MVRLRGSTLLLILALGFSGSLAVHAGDPASEEGAPDAIGEAPTLWLADGHRGPVVDVTASADEAHVLTASEDGTARLWETATGREIRRFVGHEGIVTAARFVDGDTSVLTASEDGTARLWRVDTGEETRRYAVGDPEGASILSLAVSNTGACFAAGLDDGTAILVDRASGARVHALDTGTFEVEGVAFSPNGTTLLTSGWGCAVLWDTRSGEPIRWLSSGLDEMVTAVAFTPDGRRAVGASMAGPLHLWDVATGRVVQEFEGHEGTEPSIAFSKDGARLLTAGGSDFSARVWDTASGEELERATRDPILVPSADGTRVSLLGGGRVRAVAFLPDETRILVGFEQAQAGVYDTAANQWTVFCGVEESYPIRSVAISADAAYVLLQSGGYAHLWELAEGRQIARYGSCLTSVTGEEEVPITVAAFVPGRDHFLLGTWAGDVRLHDLPSGRPIRSYAGHEGAITALAPTTDGRRIVTASADRTVRVWDAATGAEIDRFDQVAPTQPPTPWEEARERFGPARGDITSVAFSPDGTRVVAAEQHRTILLWEPESSEAPRRIDLRMGIASASFCSDGRTVVAYGSGFEGEEVLLLDAETAQVERGFVGDAAWDKTPPPTSSLSPDGRWVLTSSWDGSARLWDAKSGEVAHVLPARGVRPGGFAFFPGSDRVLVGYDDGTASLWETATGRETCRLILSEGSGAVVDPDGRYDVQGAEAPWLYWVMPDDPMRSLSLELFMRDYYEPRLLPRLLAGEVMAPVKDLMSLNRAQPHVEVVAVEPDPQQEGSVRVTVACANRSHPCLHEEGAGVWHSGVHDLRLFRDGQIVKWVDGELEVGESGLRKTFAGIRVAESAEATWATFSAYAFNADGVKSATSRYVYEAPARESPHRGTAYVIAFGVDEFADPVWDLSYAAADARLVVSSLGDALRETGAWARVVPVLLTSTEGEDRARKADLRAVLGALAGEPVSAAMRARIPELESVRRACPEDFVLLALSTHGIAASDGRFLLLPSDIASKAEALHASCISTDDLERWLRPVDAGELAMIVDACQSAASVATEGFKPGPMASRGFGQLAWNKRMRILAASQASEYALESRSLRHGLLTHALVREGLEARAADVGPVPDGAVQLGEWLRYAEARVPQIAAAIATGGVEAVGPRGRLRPATRPAVRRLVQRPALFDFSRTGARRILVRRAESPGD